MLTDSGRSVIIGVYAWWKGVVNIYFRPGAFCFSFGEKNVEGDEMLFPVCVADCTASATINDFLSHHLLMSLKGTVTE